MQRHLLIISLALFTYFFRFVSFRLAQRDLHPMQIIRLTPLRQCYRDTNSLVACRVKFQFYLYLEHNWIMVFVFVSFDGCGWTPSAKFYLINNSVSSKWTSALCNIHKSTTVNRNDETNEKKKRKTKSTDFAWSDICDMRRTNKFILRVCRVAFNCVQNYNILQTAGYRPIKGGCHY